MDQIKIGNFIAMRRKQLSLTQRQLAETLGVSDRAVSKWETGRAMPDVAIMLDLCGVLGISVNELLSGEIIKMENYNKELEKNLLELAKEKEQADKRLLALECVIGGISTLILFVQVILGAVLPNLLEWQRILIIMTGFIPFFIGITFALIIEQSVGYYECQCCGHRYVPKFLPFVMAMHMGRTRYLKCPKCGQKSWQKKVINKTPDKE